MKKLIIWFKNRHNSIKINRQQRLAEECYNSVKLSIVDNKILMTCRGVVIEEFSDSTLVSDITSVFNSIKEYNTKYQNLSL